MEVIGGAKRDRTADLLHAMQALSQLSYSPTMSFAVLLFGAAGLGSGVDEGSYTGHSPVDQVLFSLPVHFAGHFCMDNN